MCAYYNDDEDEISLNSEVLWTFKNFKKEVLDAYPTGRCISEQLVTVGGDSTWKVDFYPNGKDNLTAKKITVVITLIKSKERSLLVKTEAECNYRFSNQTRRINYAGKIDRQKFKSFVSAQDSSFDSDIFYKDFTDSNDNNFLISIRITQFRNPEKSEEIKFNTNLRSLQVNNSNNNTNAIGGGGFKPTTDNGNEFRKITVYPLFKKD